MFLRLLPLALLVLAARALFAQSKPDEPALTWHDVAEWGVEGRAWTDMPRACWFQRLPDAAAMERGRPRPHRRTGIPRGGRGRPRSIARHFILKGKIELQEGTE
jgi:hypothetical protein